MKLDPDFAGAHESIGYCFDVIDIDLPQAEAAFWKASQLGGGGWSWAGLARVLAEQGKPLEQILGMPDNCPSAKNQEVQELRTKLVDGYWYSSRQGLHSFSVHASCNPRPVLLSKFYWRI